MADRFEIQASYLTDTGRSRTVNQDTVRVCEPTEGDIAARFGWLYIVADGAGGVGGHNAGKIASRYASNKVKTVFYQASDLSSAGARLRSAMLTANDNIRHHVEQARRPKRMATTMVATVIRGTEMTIANVGDSRAYLIRDNEIEQITYDHSLVAGLVADGIITEEEAIHHPQRNVILYSLGSAPSDPRIDLFKHTLRPNDIVMMCSDGLFRYGDNKKLLQLIKAGPIQTAPKRLVDFANESGGADNISVIIIHAKPKSSRRWLWWLVLLIGMGLIILSGLLALTTMGWSLLGS